MQVLLPPGWPRPKGYANGVVASGRQVYIAGMIGWDAEGRFPSDDFADQARLALENIVAVLREAGGRPEHIVRMTWYVTDKREYLAAGKAVGQAFREIIGAYNAAMTAVEVKALIEDRAKVEIEVTASKASVHWDDPLLLEQQLGDDERAVRDAARAYAQDRLAPRVLEAFRHEKTDVAIFREMGELGLLGPTIPEAYGGAGLNYVC